MRFTRLKWKLCSMKPLIFVTIFYWKYLDNLCSSDSTRPSKRRGLERIGECNQNQNWKYFSVSMTTLKPKICTRCDCVMSRNKLDAETSVEEVSWWQKHLWKRETGDKNICERGKLVTKTSLEEVNWWQKHLWKR